MNLIEKLKTIDKPLLPFLKKGYSKTIAEFWDDFVAPLLPDKEIVISMYEMLLKYIDDPDAVYAIRTFGSWSNKQRDNKELRRGFYNKTLNKYSFFYTDNFFAAYFCKMVMDGYVPDYNEFKQAMVSREFPARFGRYDKKFEKVKAAYSIDGKKGKDPLFSKNGYTIAHIINAGKNFFVNGKNMTIQQICNIYFPRGTYDDWKLEEDNYGKLYVRNLGYIEPIAREILKAHFLRFVCPLNYILTPGKNNHITETKVYLDDIAESVELQQYAIKQFQKIYGKIYDDYMSKIMIAPIKMVENCENLFIGIDYGYGIRNKDKKANCVSEKKGKKNIMSKENELMSGKYARKVFSDLLKSKKLDEDLINKLRDKAYCSKEMGISFPILVEIGVDQFDINRYYKSIEHGKYMISSQWYDRNVDLIKKWLVNNGLN